MFSASSSTRTVVRTSRRLSISVVASNSPPILRVLPSELIITILELVLLNSKKNLPALLHICRDICALTEKIIYRTVVLSSASMIQLFHRAVQLKPAAFLKERVKQLAVTCGPEACTLKNANMVAEIVGKCRGLHSVALPSFTNVPLKNVLAPLALSENATQITVAAYNDDKASSSRHAPIFPDASTAITCLSISEPSETWQSPLSILNAFGPLPQLSHLQLARRTSANEENDAIFVEEIMQILRDRPKKLVQLVVSVFSPAWFSDTQVEESNIWRLLQEKREVDERIVVKEGRYGEWLGEWDGQEAVVRPINPAKRWAVKMTAPAPSSA